MLKITASPIYYTEYTMTWDDDRIFIPLYIYMNGYPSGNPISIRAISSDGDPLRIIQIYDENDQELITGLYHWERGEGSGYKTFHHDGAQSRIVKLSVVTPTQTRIQIEKNNDHVIVEAKLSNGTVDTDKTTISTSSLVRLHPERLVFFFFFFQEEELISLTYTHRFHGIPPSKAPPGSEYVQSTMNHIHGYL
jgi:hypothetical protein